MIVTKEFNLINKPIQGIELRVKDELKHVPLAFSYVTQQLVWKNYVRKVLNNKLYQITHHQMNLEIRGYTKINNFPYPNNGSERVIRMNHSIAHNIEVDYNTNYDEQMEFTYDLYCRSISGKLLYQYGDVIFDPRNSMSYQFFIRRIRIILVGKI